MEERIFVYKNRHETCDLLGLGKSRSVETGLEKLDYFYFEMGGCQEQFTGSYCVRPVCSTLALRHGCLNAKIGFKVDTVFLQGGGGNSVI